MSVARLKRKAETTGERGLAAVQRATTRGAAYAKAQVSDLAAQGQRLAHGVDGQIQEVTGRRGTTWIEDASHLVGNNLWATLALAALAFFAFLVLLP